MAGPDAVLLVSQRLHLASIARECVRHVCADGKMVAAPQSNAGSVVEICSKKTRSFMKRYYGLGITFAVLISVIVYFAPTDNMRWDPSYYYAQMQSPLIDGDLDFRADTLPQSQAYTATGLQGSPWPIGTSIAWSPFFLLAQAYMFIRGKDDTGRGFVPDYLAAVSAGSALYGLLGLFFIYRLCRLFAPRWIAAQTSFLALFATPLFYYVYRQPFMAHSSSFLISALLTYVLFLIQQDKIPVRYYGLVIGASLGLSIILRRIGVVSVIPVLVYGIYLVIKDIKNKDMFHLKQIVLQALIAICVGGIVVSPQLIFEYKLYGGIFETPRSTGFSDSLVPWNVWNLLFHTNRGLLFWAPFILFGLLGLYKLKVKPLKYGFIAYILAYMYILGIWNDWYGGGGYGSRYFIEIIPLSALGWALLANALAKKAYQNVLLSIGNAVLALHQLILVAVVENGWVAMDRYFAAQPLGARFQFDALVNVVKNPVALLLPRSATAFDRQSILMNYVAGADEVRFYFFGLVALCIIVPGVYVFLRYHRFIRIPVGFLCVIAYAFFWAGLLISI
jgi:hypothetical protein